MSNLLSSDSQKRPCKQESMRALLQRVREASVSIGGKMHASIGPGLLIFFGVGQSDSEEDLEFLIKKCSVLRIFNDPDGKMNLSLFDVKGEALVISQFTLHANTRKGNRPSYGHAAPPEEARRFYEKFLAGLEERFPGRVKSGIFAAEMAISLINDGPVTIMLDSREK